MSCPCGCEDVRDPTTGQYELCPTAEGWYESLAEVCPGERCKCDECMPDIVEPKEYDGWDSIYSIYDEARQLRKERDEAESLRLAAVAAFELEYANVERIARERDLLIERNHSLERCVDEAEKLRLEAVASFDHAYASIRRIARERDALRNYALHTTACAKYKATGPTTCTCGLANALREPSPEGEEQF